MLGASEYSPKWKPLDQSQPKRVLVVDDDAVVREIAKPVLEGLGYQVLLMEDGLYDDRLFARIKVDAAIIDLGLPGGVSGLDVIQKLRDHGQRKDIPIFVITGSTNVAEIRSCYEDFGAMVVLSKPVDWQFLVKELKANFAA